MASVRVQRDLEDTRILFEAWLSSKMPGASDLAVSDLSLSSTGASNQTVFCAVRWRAPDGSDEESQLVLRIQPDAEARVLPELGVEHQHQLLHVLHERHNVVVPAARAYESDPAVLGAPFLVMDRVEGRALSDVPSWHVDGWATELSAPERTRMCSNALAGLASVHKVDWRDGFEFLATHRAHTPLDSYLRQVETWFEWAVRGRDVGVIDDALRYVLANRPTDDACGVLWGDARLGNMLFDQDLSVAAMLDWDMAALGPAEVDLGWWLMMDEFFSGAQGIPRLAGVLSREETISRYEQLIGRPVRDIRYYEILGGLRFALVMVRATDHQERRGLVGPDSKKRTNNPLTQMLAHWLGLEPPELAPEWAAVARAWTKKE